MDKDGIIRNYRTLYIMSFIQTDLFTATSLKEKGMQTAIDHADAVCPGWSDTAYKFFIEWLSQKKSGYPFMVEEVREAAAMAGIPEPPSKRAWGGLTAKARRNGHIVSIGAKPTKGKSAHNCYASVWVKTLN
jgi:hypothetical protein